MQSIGELRASIAVSSKIERTPRAMQLEGLFDIPPAERSGREWDVCLPLGDRAWNIGLIVGPSGSGKSTVARKFFGKYLQGFGWHAKRSVADSFPEDMPIRDICELLSSVGFSSPPSWLRPFHVLSTGEQFRVTMARTLAEQRELAVVDEFTSVVDRTVAQIGSAAIAKTVRRRGQQFIAVTCHQDIIGWLQPDWIYRPDLNEFQWRELQRFPAIELVVRRVHHSAWKLFRQHHYLSSQLRPGAVCFAAFLQDRPAAFSSWMSIFGSGPRNRRREHRTVTLPDFQGVGIGNRLSECIASMWRGLGIQALSTTSHPAMIAYRNRSSVWRMVRVPSLKSADTNPAVRRSTARLTAGFEFIGPAMEPDRARSLLAA